MHVPTKSRIVSPCLLVVLSTLVLAGCNRNVPSVAVTPVPPPPSISLRPTTVTPGQSATLTWSSANYKSCVAGGAWSGTVATSGSTTVILNGAAAQTYSITCYGGVIPEQNSATLGLSPSLGGCPAKSAKRGHAKRTHRISGSHA